MKAEGVKSGVPDICLPVARREYHGLYIELKRRQGGHLSVNQRIWIDELIKQRYRAVVCYGWEQAANEIVSYLMGRV